MDKRVIFVMATVFLIGASALADPQKTRQGLRKGGTMLLKMLPSLVTIIILVSVFL